MRMFKHPAIKDIKEGIGLWRYWSYRALLNYKLRYSGTRLFYLWPGLSLLFVALVLGTVWGIVLHRQDTTAYFVYLATGFAFWQFLSGAVNQGSREIGGLGGTSSVAVIIFERWTILIIALLNVLPFVLLARLPGSPDYTHLIYLPLAFLCLALWSIGVLMTVLVLVTVFPDLRQVVQSIMRLAFLATPIIWEASKLGQHQQYLWFNPFFPPLELARYAVTGQSGMLESLVYALPYSLFLFILGLACFVTQYARIRARIT